MKKNKRIPIIILTPIALVVLIFASYKLSEFILRDTVSETSEIDMNVPINNGYKSSAKLTIYDAPNLARAAADTTIFVNDNEVFTYNTAVNNSHSWVEGGDPPKSYTPMTYFDFEGKVKIDIHLRDVKNPSDVIVRPISAGITPKVEDNIISFYITEPGQYTVEYNGSIERAIHIFANPLEKDIPDKNDPNVIFIEPGFWNIDSITLEDNQTLYISGGAMVYGTVRANGAKNVTIRGRGIMDGGVYSSWTHGVGARHPVDFIHCDGIKLEGIIFTDSNAWVVNALSSKNAEFNNIKVISARQNGDGITLQSCENFLITNSFVRSWDDSLVVKNYEGSSNNITFDNIQLWTDLAQSMEIGYETNKGSYPYAMISNITFKNITVLHNFHKPVISVHNGDDALVTDIVFSGITVEDAMMGEGDAGNNKQLIDLTILYNGNWSKTNDRGHLRNILIENVNVLAGKKPTNRIIGYGPDNTVENVIIRNVTALGEKITSFEDGDFTTNEYIDNITFETTEDINSDSEVNLSIINATENIAIDTEVTRISSEKQTKVLLPAFIDNAEFVKEDLGENLALNKPVKANAYGDVYEEINAVDGVDTTYWEGEADEYPNIITVDLENMTSISKVRILLNPDSIWGKRTMTYSVSVSDDGENFSDVVNESGFDFNPRTGNLMTHSFDSIETRFVRIIFTGNTGAYAGQIAEFEIYA